MDMTTHEDWWDCECMTNYQHHKDTDLYCYECDTHEHESPDSIVEELIKNKKIPSPRGLRRVK